MMKIEELGTIDYKTAFDYQSKLFNEKISKKNQDLTCEDHLLICEHPHVYTIGKSGDTNNLLVNDDFLKTISATYHQSDRGGDITYHGPGQIVVYPIIDLDKHKLSINDYIYKLEYLIIDILKNFKIEGEISPGNIGVWLDVGKPGERKICSIGVKVSRSISMHGLAFNIDTDLSYFNHINPCGFIERGVTSLNKELSDDVDIREVRLKLIDKFIKTFKIRS